MVCMCVCAGGGVGGPVDVEVLIGCDSLAVLKRQDIDTLS